MPRRRGRDGACGTAQADALPALQERWRVDPAWLSVRIRREQRPGKSHARPTDLLQQPQCAVRLRADVQRLGRRFQIRTAQRDRRRACGGSCTKPPLPAAYWPPAAPVDCQRSERTWQRIWNRFDLGAKPDSHGFLRGTVMLATPSCWLRLARRIQSVSRRRKSSPISRPLSRMTIARSPLSNSRSRPSLSNPVHSAPFALTHGLIPTPTHTHDVPLHRRPPGERPPGLMQAHAAHTPNPAPGLRLRQSKILTKCPTTQAVVTEPPSFLFQSIVARKTSRTRRTSMKQPSVYLKMRVLGAVDTVDGRTRHERIQHVAASDLFPRRGWQPVRQFTWRTIPNLGTTAATRTTASPA